jgi:AraC-like DNA-binding protein
VNDPDRVLFESPVAFAGEFRCPVDHPRFEITGPTRQYCFVFPRQACWIEQQGHRPFVADATVVPLYNRGTPYRRGVIDAEGDRTDWFGVQPDVLREMVATFDPHTASASDRLFTRPFVPATAPTFLTQRRVFDHLHSAPVPDVLFVEETVLSVLGDVLERQSAPAPISASRASHVALADAARAHLATTFRRRDGIADVASAIGTSPFHLSRVFHGVTGLTLHRHRTELRLRWSLAALRDGADILSVALEAGFAHHSHFTAAFRRTFGVRPSEFRGG